MQRLREQIMREVEGFPATPQN